MIGLRLNRGEGGTVNRRRRLDAVSWPPLGTKLLDPFFPHLPVQAFAGSEKASCRNDSAM